MFRAPCTHHQEVKIVLDSLWYRHTCRWPSRAPVHGTATYRPDYTRGCLIQFWPPDDEHMCSKHVEAWNKLIVKQKFCASSWLITEIKKRFSINSQNVKFRENPFSGSRVSPCGWTSGWRDRSRQARRHNEVLIVGFRSFAFAPKKKWEFFLECSVSVC